jgi:hypothetical protein
MKAVLSFLALAASAFGADLAKRWPVTTTTDVYYTTTTVCPVTTTSVAAGKTTIVTYTTTSTITVASEVTVTIPGPTGYSTTTDVIITYETPCAVTETVTAPGTTYVTTYTTTSTIEAGKCFFKYVAVYRILIDFQLFPPRTM